jgi:hypothetical protein
MSDGCVVVVVGGDDDDAVTEVRRTVSVALAVDVYAGSGA